MADDMQVVLPMLKAIAACGSFPPSWTMLVQLMQCRWKPSGAWRGRTDILSQISTVMKHNEQVQSSLPPALKEERFMEDLVGCLAAEGYIFKAVIDSHNFDNACPSPAP